MFRISMMYLSFFVLLITFCFAASRSSHDSDLSGIEPHRQLSDSLPLSSGGKPDQKPQENEPPKKAFTLTDTFLSNPVIEIFQRRFRISLSDELKEEIKKGNESLILEVQRRIAELEDDAEPSSRVEGFNIFLDRSKIFVQTYLGKNAK